MMEVKFSWQYARKIWRRNMTGSEDITLRTPYAWRSSQPAPIVLAYDDVIVARLNNVKNSFELDSTGNIE